MPAHVWEALLELAAPTTAANENPRPPEKIAAIEQTFRH
jgi:hypothetical protein